MQLISFTDKGLYCDQGDFYIDPWLPVPKAVITHAHSDHARIGNEEYLCQHDTLPLLKWRLGENNYQSAGWKEEIKINGVSISFYPAGHIIGSAQVRIEYKGEVWVVSGDYKIEDDGLSAPFEPVRCNTFITESTFGLPIYSWKPQKVLFDELQAWIKENNTTGNTSIFIAYSLGKAQRILQPLAATGIQVYVHGAVWNIHKVLQDNGWPLPNVIRITPETTREELKGAIVIAPSSAEGTAWMKRFPNHSIGICSGWMQVRGNVRRKNADAGFVISDHADWNGLLQAVTATGAETVYTTHGFQSAFSRYLSEKGMQAFELKTAFGNEEEEEQPNIQNSES